MSCKIKLATSNIYRTKVFNYQETAYTLSSSSYKTFADTECPITMYARDGQTNNTIFQPNYTFPIWAINDTEGSEKYQVTDENGYNTLPGSPQYFQDENSYTLFGTYVEPPAPVITKFYWDDNTGSTDNTLISTGTNISNLTATRWNRLQNKIKEIDENYTKQTVNSGDVITATKINNTLQGIRDILLAKSITSITVPANVTQGSRIYAKIFNGTNGNVYSMKNAINYIIDNL